MQVGVEKDPLQRRVISCVTQTVFNQPPAPQSSSLVLPTPTCGRSTSLVQIVPAQLFTPKSCPMFLVSSCLMCVSCHPRSPAVVAAGSFNGEVRKKASPWFRKTALQISAILYSATLQLLSVLPFWHAVGVVQGRMVVSWGTGRRANNRNLISA